MKPISIETLAQVTGGRLTSGQTESRLVESVNTDSRKSAANSLFVAIAGENFDGHSFVPQSRASGAVAALVEKDISAAPNDLTLIRVESTRIAMGKIARHVRNQFKGRVIAVAGSNGKTSTKHLIHSVLSSKLNGSMSPKSFNNDIGVPLAIFDADPSHDFLVLEMGTNHPGEIRTLTHIGAPDIAVITNTGEEHLEFLGDLNGVRSENASIAEGLAKDGLMIVNGDDTALPPAVRRFGVNCHTFGFGSACDLFALNIELANDSVRFNTNDSTTRFFVPQLGRHTAANALAAIAVGRRIGMNDDEIARGLASASKAEMRLEFHRVGVVNVLNDAYNANPASMRAALQTFAELPARGRRVAILGDMRELGETGERYHHEIGEAVAKAKVDVLICVGALSRFVAESAEKRGISATRIHRFDDSKSASQSIENLILSGDTVLLKASRGVKLELVAKELAKCFAGKGGAAVDIA